jgi:CheY-like chemotaxis protein
MTIVRPGQPDDRPDYFAPAPFTEDAVLRRIKGNFRRQMISKSILNEGLASIPELWCAHNIPEHFKGTLTATAGPRARGGEDLPDLTEGEVEIARLSLVNSVHGEVTSLRAKRDQHDRSTLLSMVDEYETEFKLVNSRVLAPLTAAEVLAVFRDADPTPLATTCQVEFSSFFYPNLDAIFAGNSKPELEDDPKTQHTESSDQGASSMAEELSNALHEISEALKHKDAVGIVTCIGPFIYFIAKNDPGLPGKVAAGVSQGTAILGAIFAKKSAEGASGRHQAFRKYADDESGKEILQMALDKTLATPGGGKNSELLNISEIEAALQSSREGNTCGDAHSRESVSGTRDFSGYEATKLAEELREQSKRLKNDRAYQEAVLDEPYHLFFFSAIDRSGVTRFFDIMRQENGFSLAETATSAPRLGQCVETVYGNPAGGGTHHVHRNYGEFRTHTALQAMEEFAKLEGVTEVTELAETLNQREAMPTWKRIFEELGCESASFSMKSVNDYRMEAHRARSNSVQSRRILVVHHERLIAEVICAYLKEDKYETRVETASEDAIGAARQFPPNLLVIDPVMPGISGVDAAKRIFDETRCKVLLVSAMAGESGFTEILNELRTHGCDCEAFPTPFEKEDLLEHVRRRMGSETVVLGNTGRGVRRPRDVDPKADSSKSMIDFAKMTPVMPDAELPAGFVRIIMPDGKCFDIMEELWTEARRIEPGCVIMSLKATGKKQK